MHPEDAVLNNPTQEEFYDILKQKKDLLLDEAVDPDEFDLQIQDEGIVVSLNAGHIPMRNSAVSQMLSRVEVPPGFFSRCPEYIKQHLLDYFCIPKSFLFRMIKEQGSLVVRAALSSSFPTHLDNDQIFPLVYDHLSKAALTRIKSFSTDRNLSILRCPIEGASSSWENIDLQASVTITNSEIGNSSLWIDPSVHAYDKERREHIFFSNRASAGARIVHRGQINLDKLRDAITNAVEASQVGIAQLIEARHAPTTHEEVEHFMDNTPVIPKRFSSMLLAEFQEKANLNKLEVAIKILEAIKDLPLLQNAQVEQAVGGYIQIFRGHRARFTSLMRDTQREVPTEIASRLEGV